MTTTTNHSLELDTHPPQEAKQGSHTHKKVCPRHRPPLALEKTYSSCAVISVWLQGKGADWRAPHLALPLSPGPVGIGLPLGFAHQGPVLDDGAGAGQDSLPGGPGLLGLCRLEDLLLFGLQLGLRGLSFGFAGQLGLEFWEILQLTLPPTQVTCTCSFQPVHSFCIEARTGTQGQVIGQSIRVHGAAILLEFQH